MSHLSRLAFVRALMLCLACVSGAIALAADKLPAAEKTKIETLLEHVGALKGAQFIRNGSEYDSSTAAKFLRGKWESDSGVDSARAFIERVATKSSTTGKEYKIKMSDGTVMTSNAYLTAELKKIEGP